MQLKNLKITAMGGGLRKNGDHKKLSSKFWIQGVEPSVCAQLSACYLLVSFLHLEKGSRGRNPLRLTY